MKIMYSPGIFLSFCAKNFSCSGQVKPCQCCTMKRWTWSNSWENPVASDPRQWERLTTETWSQAASPRKDNTDIRYYQISASWWRNSHHDTSVIISWESKCEWFSNVDIGVSNQCYMSVLVSNHPPKFTKVNLWPRQQIQGNFRIDPRICQAASWIRT